MMNSNANPETPFRQLCRLAVKYGIDPKTYMRLLIHSGLSASRACEIKVVLDHAAIAKRFTAKNSTLTWAAALHVSRRGWE
ncbi:MAG: hypothetical protein ABSH48_13455 [Verrucomicrobiota bacterium]|jgi:hypothetical protein